MSQSNLSVGYKAWIDRINESYQECSATFLEYRTKSVEAIVRTGRLLNQCKESVGHGEFGKVIEDKRLKMDERTAQRFMGIARDERLSNPTNLSLLPAVVDTLHKLTKLKGDAFDQAVEAGVINPEMRARDVPTARSPRPTPVTDAEYTVTESPDPERAAGADPDGKPPGPARQETPEYPDNAGGAEWTFYTPGHQPPREGLIPCWIDPSDPMNMLAAGTLMVLWVIKELKLKGMAMKEVMAQWPSDTPMLSDDFDELAFEIEDAAVTFRALYGNGNDAALQSDAAE
jgi:hypothetical protein